MDSLEFEGGPHDLAKFRMLVLRRALTVALSVGIFVMVLVAIGFLKFPVQQVINNLIFLAVSLGCYAALRFDHRSFQMVRAIHLISMVIFFTAGCIYFPADRMGYAWFFICVGSAFLPAETWAGLAVTFASVIGILFAQSQSKTISTDEAGTICCALICASAIFCIFERQTRESMHSLRMVTARLHDLAHKDALTGVANRMAFDKVSAAVLRRPRPCCLVILDLDHFKKVNDIHGHVMGDHVLKTVAGVISSSIRPGDFVARIGGEEFVILLPDTALQEAEDVANHVRCEIVRTPIQLNETLLAVTASLGVATSSFNPFSADAFKTRADTALYEAKHAGRNCVRVFTSDNLLPYRVA